MRLAVLDQSPLRSGATPEQALAETVALAQHCEALGYERFWVAEHHGSGGLMGAAPEVLIARIASATERIRVGSGGVMLSHYSPYKVAEQFAVLEALFPGRIDLGLGRAPGSDGLTAAALSYGNRVGGEYYGAKVVDCLRWSRGEVPHTEALQAVKLSPAHDHPPQPWLLGSTDQSAQLAAHLGVGFAFAHFIAPDQLELASRLYHERFEPSASCSEPRFALAAFALCSEDPEALADMTLCRDAWRRRMRAGGEPGPWPTPQAARVMLGDDHVATGEGAIAGDGRAVLDTLRTLAERSAAECTFVVTITPEFEQRLESYSLLARARAEVGDGATVSAQRA